MDTTQRKAEVFCNSFASCVCLHENICKTKNERKKFEKKRKEQLSVLVWLKSCAYIFLCSSLHKLKKRERENIFFPFQLCVFIELVSESEYKKKVEKKSQNEQEREKEEKKFCARFECERKLREQWETIASLTLIEALKNMKKK